MRKFLHGLRIMSPCEILFQRYPSLQFCREAIEKAYDTLIAVFESGGKLLVAGNGGSASDAGHLSGELLKSFCKKRIISNDLREKLGEEMASQLEGALPVIPLPDFVSFHTAYANDRDVAYAFAQLVLALGRENDAFLGISTSGNSKNIIHAIQVAHAKKMKVIGLTGKSGGKMREYCSPCICVSEDETFKIQELHLPVYHALCQELENYFF